MDGKGKSGEELRKGAGGSEGKRERGDGAKMEKGREDEAGGRHFLGGPNLPSRLKWHRSHLYRPASRSE